MLPPILSSSSISIGARPAQKDTQNEEVDDDFDSTGEDAIDIINCPECKQPIDADSDECPHCHFYILDDDLPQTPNEIAKRKRQKLVIFLMIGTLVVPFVLWLIQFLQVLKS